MEKFVMEQDFDPKYIAPDDIDFEDLEKPALVAKIKELIQRNERLRESMIVTDEIYADRISAARQEVDELSKKLIDYEKSSEVEKLESSKHQSDSLINATSGSQLNNFEKSFESSKDEEKDREEEEKKMKARRKEIIALKETFKSPSVLLKEHDAEYVNNLINNQSWIDEEIDDKIWKKEIIPRLKEKDQRQKNIAKIKATMQNSFPKSLRNKLWPFLIGNPLVIKRKIYDQLCKSMETCPVDEKTKNHISILITNIFLTVKEEDLTRIYPHLKSFHAGKNLNDELQYLLEIFCFARPDIGYVQGIAYPASMLLFYLDHYHAFKSLTNLVVCRPFLTNLYKFNLEEIRLMCRVFERLLKQKAPQAQKHLEKLSISPEVYLIEWLVTLFCRSFPIRGLPKIWDLFLLEGEVVLYKVALALFQIIELNLIKKDYAETLYYIRSCTMEVDFHTLLKNIRNSGLTQEKLEASYEKARKKKKEGLINLFS